MEFEEIDLAERFLDATNSDGGADDREIKRSLVPMYERSDEYTRCVIDDVFINLCGYSLNTLLNAPQKDDEYSPDYANYDNDESHMNTMANYYRAKHKNNINNIGRKV
tara:strand:+ start:1349 stop:1672 length:324 start_codon:yes stop_codon:yes gene_type:complete